MKTLIKISIPILLFFFSTNIYAVVNPNPNTTTPEKENITVEEFLELTPSALEKRTGKELKWGQRGLLKAAQKRLRKKLSKGKIQLDDKLIKKEKEGRLSLYSLWFGIISVLAGLLTLLFIILAIVNRPNTTGVIIGLIASLITSLLASVAGLIYGILGLEYEERTGMVIIGMFLSILTLGFWIANIFSALRF